MTYGYFSTETLCDQQFRTLPISNYEYNQVGDPAVTPIDIVDLKSHIRLDYVDEKEEAYLKLLIQAAVSDAEYIMNRCLITRDWITYRDKFEEVIEIRRPPFVSLTSFKYYNLSGVQISLPVPTPPSRVTTDYYITNAVYPLIIPDYANGKSFPEDCADRKQAIEIQFKAGYGTNKTDVPEDIRAALCHHVAYLYANRGDSDLAGTTGEVASIPRYAKRVYDQYRIAKLTGTTYY